MTRKTRGRRYADDETDLYDGGREGNPHARRSRRKARFPQIPRWVYRVGLILCVSVLGLLVWFNRANLTPSNVAEWVQARVVGMGVGDGFPSPISNGRTVAAGNFLSADKEAVMVSDTALTILNSTAKELVRRQHSFSNPVLRAAGSRILIYNLGGSGFQLENYSKTVRKGSGGDNILAGAIAQNGRYALATEADGYCAKLTAYLPDHSAQYVYEFSDYYVTDIALNRNGSRAAVAAVSASGGGLVSAVYLFDFSNPEPVKVLTYPENLMLSVDYGSNGTIVAVGDRLTSVIGEGGGKTDYSYGSQTLTAFAADNGRTALSLAPYANAAQGSLVLLNDLGKQAARVELKRAAGSLALYGDTAAVLAGGTVSAYSAATGASLGSCDAGSDARVIALHDEGSVYILGVSEIRFSAF